MKLQSTILRTIWQHSEGDYVFLPSKDPGTGQWIEPPTLCTHDAVSVVLDWPQPEYEGLDLYYTPGTFTGEERKKEFAAPMGVLYADLDDDFNRDRLKMVDPSLLTETSHGRYQAVWLLDEPLAVSAAESLNRRLSHWLGADYGSWIITKVLRVPGSMNWKRGGQRVEVVSWDPDRVFGHMEFDAFLPYVGDEEFHVAQPSDHPPLPTSEQSRARIKHWWPTLDHRTKELLTISHPVDRSLHLARLARGMAVLGIPPEDIFVMLWNLPANKFRNRPHILWESVILTGGL